MTSPSACFDGQSLHISIPPELQTFGLNLTRNASHGLYSGLKLNTAYSSPSQNALKVHYPEPTLYRLPDLLQYRVDPRTAAKVNNHLQELQSRTEQGLKVEHPTHDPASSTTKTRRDDIPASSFSTIIGTSSKPPIPSHPPLLLFLHLRLLLDPQIPISSYKR